jgi:hypothetical protein
MKIIVHEATMAEDCEDPTIYASVPIYEWEQSDSGKWVKEHALASPVWQTTTCVSTYRYIVRIVADLKEEDITYFKLKWGKFK